jgi:hypothetical protein
VAATDFAGPVESPVEELAIGLGKQKGADTFHSRGYGEFPRLIPAVAAAALARLPIPFGIALVENAFSRCALVEAVPAARLAEREPQLLALARERLGRLPEPSIDVLLVDHIGKDVSGAGADPNVLNRDFVGIVDRTLDRPHIQRVVFRDLTDDTEGNATGVALADIVTRRLVDRIDVARTYMNAVTSKNTDGARVPLTADSDRQALHWRRPAGTHDAGAHRPHREHEARRPALGVRTTPGRPARHRQRRAAERARAAAVRRVRTAPRPLSAGRAWVADDPRQGTIGHAHRADHPGPASPRAMLDGAELARRSGVRLQE